MKAILDIETDLAWTQIWMAGVYLPDSGRSISCRTPGQLTETLKDVTEIIGHNLIGFDLPRLEEIWGWEPTCHQQITDTLVLARLLDPSIEGGHSLKQWAIRAGGALKEDFATENFDAGWSQAMEDYCLADCAATYDVYLHIVSLLDAEGFSEECRQLEHGVAYRTAIQERTGFGFDWQTACTLYTDHDQRMQAISESLQSTFPPIVEERWSEKTGKRLKDKVTVFNVGSRQQVAERLAEKGAEWSRLTPTTGKPVIDEKSLEENIHIPEAKMVLEYLVLQKRSGMLKSWLDAVGDDGRIHGRVNTCGAVTGRMTHSSPNMAQIPSEPEYRSCFIVDEGNKLVGVDASGLELRMLAHYMQDETYTDLILNGDIHSYNQKAFGCSTRDQAKTLIYATLYGAGDGKLGSIVGGNGGRVRANFERAVPAYAELVKKVQRISACGSVPGLDGRRVRVRSEHAALNTLLQSAGAIVMKEALLIACDKLDGYGYPYKLVAQVHDEFQIEVPEQYAQRVGVVFRNAIREAGRKLNLRCPLDGEYQIGDNWSQTH